jgi:hypothetical protein
METLYREQVCFNINLCKQGHQAVNDHIGYENETEEEPYGIFHLLQINQVNEWFNVLFG